MRARVIVASLGTVMVCAAGSSGRAATMDFETVPRTLFGAAYGDAPGDVVLTQDGIAMSVEEFLLDPFIGFIEGEVGGSYSDFFPTTPAYPFA